MNIIIAVVNTECDWSGAENWVQWWPWNTKKHLQAKPFSIMNPSDWDKAPRNTNGVERANASAKSGGQKPSLYAAMQSLYEKDNLFALQYIAAVSETKITYRSPMDEEQRSQASIKRKCQNKIADKNVSYGPPDKSEHFLGSDDDFDDLSKPEKSKVAQENKKESSDKKEVEVLYSDGIWYRGWLGEYNFETGKWKVHFMKTMRQLR